MSKSELDRIAWDLCAEDCSKSFKTKNHVRLYSILLYLKCALLSMKSFLKNTNHIFKEMRVQNLPFFDTTFCSQ